MSWFNYSRGWERTGEVLRGYLLQLKLPKHFLYNCRSRSCWALKKNMDWYVCTGLLRYWGDVPSISGLPYSGMEVD